MFDDNQVQPLDYLLYRKNGDSDWLGNLIEKGSVGEYVHIARYIGNGMKIEEHFQTGCVKVPMNKEEYGRIDIWRYYKPIVKWKQNRITKWLEKKVKINAKYDFKDCANSITSTFGHLLNWRWLKNVRPLFPQDEKAYDCSTLQLHADRYGYINSVVGVNSDAVSPSDFSRTKRIIKIS